MTRRRVGRRALVLRVLAGLWLLMAVIVATTGRDIDPGDAILYEIALPVPVRVAMWGIPAIVALAASYYRHWQDAGWMALAVMPAERAISHTWSLAHGLIPGEPPGTTWEGAASLLLWAGVTHLVLILAGWDEDTPMDGRD